MSSAQEVGQIFATADAPHGPATALLRSPTVLIASIGLWAMNVYLFEIFGIDYKRVLQSRQKKEKKEDLGGDENTINIKSKKMKKEGNLSSSFDNLSGVIGTSTSLSNLPSSHGVVSSSSTPSMKVNNDVEQRVVNGNIISNGVAVSHNLSGKSSPVGTLVINSDLITEKNGVLLTSPTTSNISNEKGMEINLDGGLDNEITAGKLFFLCFVLLMLLHFTTEIILHFFGGNAFEAIVSFYFVCILLMLTPFTRPEWLFTALKVVHERVRSLLVPRCREIPQTTQFIDVFFADAMCSLSKVFFDWGLLWTMLYHYPHAIPESLSSIMLPSLLSSWPYIIRARQCMISFAAGTLKKDPRRFDHVLNAIKYCTSLFPICLSAYQKTLSSKRAHDFDILFIFLLIINSLYSFIWDVVMDWGMAQEPTYVVGQTCGAKPVAKSFQTALLRPRLRFGILVSTAIIATDLLLRFSWVLRFFHASLFDSFDTFVLTTQFLEVFRRAIWNLLRVEWEILKTAPPTGKGKEEVVPLVFPGSIEMKTVV